MPAARALGTVARPTPVSLSPRFASASRPVASFAMSSSSRNDKTLLTFDVDGTLIRAVGTDANKFHKNAFAHAMREHHGIDTHIDVIKHHGSTDQLVAADVLRFHGVEEDAIWSKMPAVCASMVEFAAANETDAAEGLEILPGVQTLLETLAARDDCVVALVTGNLEPIAWTKMRRLGIRHLFTAPGLGGFGSDHVDRAELVAIAERRCAEATGAPVGTFANRVHFGDTPNDVKAAQKAGAFALALTTGVFSRDELETCVADAPGRGIVMEGLEDTKAVLEACGLT